MNLKLICAALVLLAAAVGCISTIDSTGKKITVIDPAKLQQVKAAVEPAAASVMRRAIQNSPQHAAEIGKYARAVGSVFCAIKSSGTFEPGFVLTAVNDATQGLQAGVDPSVIDAKNAAISLYAILWSDKLTTQTPTNMWPYAVASIFCDSINQALRDAGQVGVQ